MKRRSTLIFICCSLLAFSIGWVGRRITFDTPTPIPAQVTSFLTFISETDDNEISEESKTTEKIPPHKNPIDDWRISPPIYKEEPVIALYLSSSKNHEAWQVSDRDQAQELFRLLEQVPTLSAPDASIDYGYLLITPEGRVPLYVAPSDFKLPKQITELTTTMMNKSIPVVDLFVLLSPDQIDRIEFSGYLLDETETLVHMEVDTTEGDEISQLLTALRKMAVEELTLLPTTAEPTIPKGVQPLPNSYTITLSLGEVYQHATCQIYGYDYAFWANFSLQKNTRLYQTNTTTTQGLFDTVKEVPSCQTTNTTKTNEEINEQNN